MTVGEAHAHVRERLEGAGIEGGDVEAWLLLEAATGLALPGLRLHRDRSLSAPESRRLETWAARRERREPLQHILGKAHFYGLEMEVGPSVLVPRPETERLVELALEHLRGRPAPTVLDVGTGSGAIALALRSERPDARVTASDISEAALEVARRNAARLGLEIAWHASDLLAEPEVVAAAQAADLLTANLPYLPEADRRTVPPEVRMDPALALFAGDDGLTQFRALEPQARRHLRPGALFLAELDPRNVAVARDASRGWSQARIEADLAGRARFLLLTR